MALPSLYKKTGWLVLKILVSLVILGLIFRSIDLSKVLLQLRNLDFGILALSALVTILLMLVRTLRWRMIIRFFKSSLPLGSSVIYVVIATAFSYVTPGKVGEFVRAKYLVDDTKMSYARALGTVLVDKLFDLFVLLVISGVSATYLLELFGMDLGLPLTWLAVASSAIGVATLVAFLPWFWGSARLLPFSYGRRLSRFVLSRSVFARASLLSVLIWLGLGLQAYLVLISLAGPSADYLTVLAAVSLMTIFSMIPISFGGIGVRELVAVKFFSYMGVAPETSVIFSLLYSFISSGAVAILGAVLYTAHKK